ncbi:hypothetical protein [Streptomyces sp. Ncost-T10-10d]|uniref:hypothetical protein n=1 Tax=Streptomyces sp. Ncost-T10-10d TaxID=1839774 RepID=UPI000A6425AE|nr:hypothetical protein [Streptomyces sp. Ncost-T10-10d]
MATGQQRGRSLPRRGDPSISIDVATTGLHDHIRLALFDDGEMEALLSPKAARTLRDRLDEALRSR